MNEDGRLDAMIARAENGGCRDCEVGEPHVCPDLRDVNEDVDEAFNALGLDRIQRGVIRALLAQARADAAKKALAPVLALIDGQDIVWYGSEQWLQRLRAAAAASPDTESGE